jgi:hypothetical protein
MTQNNSENKVDPNKTSHEKYESTIRVCVPFSHIKISPVD